MTAPALRARAVRVDFSGFAALDGVDADIPAVGLTVIVGANGAGKSTLLEVLAGARAPTSGTVDAGGNSRAFVPQRTAVSAHLPLTVRDVVAVGAWGRVGPLARLRPAHRARIDEAMHLLDVTSLARHPFASLSGGQRQRTLLAQGLARSADVLLLDEPTTGLDAASIDLHRTTIAAEIARGAAVVCVSHDDRLIADADHLIHLEGGCRVTRGRAPVR